jgi:proteasome-associated ATPase
MDPSRSHFLSIKGPALLDKYVGETERRIRFIFRQAREKAHDGRPVIVFFDEMESLFRARGSGISSDVENTIVAQLLAEIDGVEELENVIVIGASNREDMIDPAILRPGRLDLKIRVNRPNREAAMDIFSKHLTPAIPIHPHDLAAHGGDDGEAIRNMIHHAVEFLYAETENNRFVEVTYESLEKEVIYFRDFSSGAAIKNIVDRAKWAAVERHLREMDVPLGVRVQDVIQAAKEEIRDTEQLTNTTNPDDWARISGARGERIVYVRTLGRSARRFSGRALNIQQSNYDL